MVRPSPALAAVIGAEPRPYAEAMGAVFRYANAHGLLRDPARPLVIMDAPLRAVFGVDQMLYGDMALALEQHLTPV